jgi:hypothetical protein
MKVIAAFEQDKAEIKAAAAAKRVIRTRTKVLKRQDATQVVTDMIVQELLAAKNPPEQFYDASHNPVTKKFLPNVVACKSFMQVRAFTNHTRAPVFIVLFTLVCIV